MAITITNTSALTLLNILNRNIADQSRLLTQLTTGKRINSGRDDPAGLIAVSGLKAELTSVGEAIESNQRSDAMLSVGDAALGEVQTLLTEIQSLAEQTASDGNLTSAEVAANQSQIDDAIEAIDRIVRTTSFNGKKLLDGSLAIHRSGVADNSDVTNLRIFSRSQSTSDTSVSITRVASAQVASATFAFAGGSARTSGTTEVSIGGALGTATVTLASGLTQDEIVTQINAATAQTGVSAIQGQGFIGLNSTAYGTDSYVSVEVLSGGVINASYGTSTGDSNTTNDVQSISKQAGVDASITLNGQTASADGLNVSYSANGLSLSFTLGSDFGTGNTVSTTTSFTVQASGGATFQLGTDSTTRATIGIDGLSSAQLGGGNGTRRLSELKSGGAAALKTDITSAISAVREAITEVATARGRVGGFQKFQVGTAISALQAMQTGLTDAVSSIEDTDFAVATAQLNQKSVLVQSGISLLGIANQRTAQILALLG